MKSEVLEKIPGLTEDVKVTIWKMNNGYRSDYQDSFTEVVGTDNKGKPIISVSSGKLKNYSLVFGILESVSLGFKKPTDMLSEMDASEINTRYRKVRNMDQKAVAHLFTKIQELNVPDDEEVLKKSSSQPTEN